MDLLLTQQERDRFAAWLEHEAAVGKGLIEQMEKLGPHAWPLVARERQQHDALWPHQQFSLTLGELLDAAERGA